MAIETINPATGKRVQSYPALTEREVENKLAAAHTASLSWRRATIEQRAERAPSRRRPARGAQARVRPADDDRDGQADRRAIDEAVKCARGCRFYADNAARFLADEPVDVAGERSFIAFQPLGVVLAVMPWNFPFWQVIRFAAPAARRGQRRPAQARVERAAMRARARAALRRGRRAGRRISEFAHRLGRRWPRARRRPRRRSHADRERRRGKQRRRRSPGSTSRRRSSSSAAATRSSSCRARTSTPRSRTRSRRARSTTASRASPQNGSSSPTPIADEFTERFVERMRALVVGDPMDAAHQRRSAGDGADSRRPRRSGQTLDRAGARLAARRKRREGPGFFYEPTVLADVPLRAPGVSGGDVRPARGDRSRARRRRRHRHRQRLPLRARRRRVDERPRGDRALRRANSRPGACSSTAWSRPIHASRLAA